MLTRRLLPLISRASIRGIRSTNQLPYTMEQQCQVLDVLNTASEEQLAKVLAPAITLRVLHTREENGPFKTLDSVFNLRGVRSNALLKFFESVLYNKTETKPLQKYATLSPPISAERILSLKTVVSVDICPPYVTFAVMDTHRTVLEMKHFAAMDAATRPSLPVLYKIATEIFAKLNQQGDIYVFEQSKPNLQQISSSKMVTQILESMLFTMLNFGEPDQPKVFQVKPNFVANLFSLRLGTEQVACDSALWPAILNGEIVMPTPMKHRLQHESPVNRESLGISILKCLGVLRVLRQ